MMTDQMTPCVVLKEIESVRVFYQKYFSAEILFDCDWYLVMKVGQAEFAWATPECEGSVPYSGEGLVYNFRVDDVDAEHKRLIEMGLEVVMPLEDHPWGDRGFSVNDPNGIALYFFTEKEADDSFKPYFKT